MLSNSHGSRQTADTASNSSEYAALQLFTDFMQKTLSQDPAFSIYMQEWENFKTLLKANPIDYEKAYAHIYRFHGILGRFYGLHASLFPYNSWFAKETSINTNTEPRNQQRHKCEYESADFKRSILSKSLVFYSTNIFRVRVVLILCNLMEGAIR